MPRSRPISIVLAFFAILSLTGASLYFSAFGETTTSSVATAITAGELATISGNVRRTVFGAVSASASALKAGWQSDLDLMAPDGSWPDLDYGDTAIEHWKAAPHLARLERIVRNECRDGPPSADVHAKLIQSLSFWVKHDPQNKNWWQNEIFVPREVGMILIMLNDVPHDLQQQAIAIVKRANWKRQTGANLLDETWIEVLRGCVEQSPDVLTEAFDRSWQEMRIVDPNQEGIQADGSFHQHGPLLYSQSYGDVFLQCAIRIIDARSGTAISPPDTSLHALDTFVMSGDAWMLRHWIWDWGTAGRAICRIGATEHSLQSEIDSLSTASAGQPKSISEDARVLKESDDTQLPLGNRHFWCSDYMVQRRADYFASARMYSTRTANTDALTTGENRKSHHIADGATCLMISGQEYFNIYPVWDWLRIPGTTIEQDTPLLPKTIKRIGKTSFVGGVSDGAVGCCTMDLQYDALHAHKSWFFFDHEIVCLGADIECGTDHSVLTTLNQCLLHGDVYDRDVHASNANSTVPPGDHRLNGPQWVWHDHIGYIIPGDAAIELKTGPQSGAWSDIGTGSSEPVTRDVFNLTIDHGQHVKHGNYEYILMPGIDVDQTADAAAHPVTQILSNSSTLQAVLETREHLISAVFHEATTVQASGLTLEVDQPCLVMIHSEPGAVQLSVADPTAVSGVVNVRLNEALRGEDVTREAGTSVVRFELPSGRDAGKTIVRHLEVVQ